MDHATHTKFSTKFLRMLGSPNSWYPTSEKSTVLFSGQMVKKIW